MTSNPVLTDAWQLIVSDADAFLLTLLHPVTIEVAATAVNTEPTISGHQFTSSWTLHITRDTLGGGYVWARVPDGTPVPVALTAW